MTARQSPDDARRSRMSKDDKRDNAYLIERKRIEVANAEKTARLRALRLTKEAADLAAGPVVVAKTRKKK